MTFDATLIVTEIAIETFCFFSVYYATVYVTVTVTVTSSVMAFI